MTSIDPLFYREDERDNYNCAHLVSEAYKLLFGIDADKILNSFLMPAKSRSASVDIRKSFIKLEKPESPCIVLMRRVGSTPHVALFYKGKALHITSMGVQYQPLDVVTQGFQKIRFYKC